MNDQLFPHQPQIAREVAPWVRRSLPAQVGFAVAAYVIGLGFFASVVPSPLYQTYRELWGFSPLTLTLIYATYAFGVLAALLLAGSVSDDVGRRPALLTALVALTGATLLFVFASSTWWLFVGRGLQGLATGIAISSASAALVDLQPRRDPVVVSVTNGVASNAGLGLGILVVSVLVQIATMPLTVPYLVLLALIALAIIAVLWMPEPVKDRQRLRLTVQRPYVPAVVRGPFLLAALGVLASWSIAGLFFSLGPQLGAELFHTTNPVMANVGVFTLLGTAALTQLTLGRTTPWLGASGGSVALAAGILLIIAGAALDSGAIYLIGSILDGFGFGLAFLGALRGLVGRIPPAHRAGVMSAFYLVGYASLSVPAVLAGLVVDSLGLQATFETFGLVAVLLSLVVAGGAWRTRPAAQIPAG
jgi:MFS family permease